MNWKEYREIIKNTPHTEGLKYIPVVLALNLQDVPLGVISLNGVKDSVIRIPEKVVNKYGKTVPVRAIGRNAFNGAEKTNDIDIPLVIGLRGRSVPAAVWETDTSEKNGRITDMVIPSGVDRICDGAFANCQSLERIVIPKRVSRIGQGTFENCSALTDIYYEGSPEEWENIRIIHRKHEVEFGELVSGTPVCEKTAERYVHIKGNEPVFAANIHFFCAI